MARRRRRFNVESTVAFITALAALLTAVYTFQLVHETRFAMGIGTLQNLEREFNEARMRRARREAAAALLRHQATEDIDHVLDFFETIALLVRRRAMDPQMVWHTFYYWIDGYGRAAADVLRENRRDHPREWEDFDQLRSQLDRIEADKGTPRPTAVHEFLTDESDLN